MTSSSDWQRHVLTENGNALKNPDGNNNDIIHINNREAKFRYTAPPIDLSFRSLSGLAGKSPVSDEEPRTHPPKVLRKTSDGRYESTSLKLNNNLLESLKGFANFARGIMDNPGALYWLDLSFNFLYTIEREILEFPQLKILYLHGNVIGALSEVDKLTEMGDLRKLTLHGNMIAEEKDYRLYVLKKLPHLKALDFSRVTRSEVDCAEHVTIATTTTKKARRRGKTSPWNGSG